MKKSLLNLSLCGLLLVTALTSCKGPGGSSVNNEGQLNFHTGYEDFVIESRSLLQSAKIDKPTDTKEGYTVLGFYKDEFFSEEVDFSKNIDVNDIYVKVLKGAGTSESPYLVESGSTLNALTHSGETLSKHVKLVKDINLTSKYTEKYENTIFDGTFDGDNHVITLSTTGNDTGLFFKTSENAVVKNVTVVGDIIGTHSSTGAVVNTNEGLITDVTTVGTEYHATNGCSNGVSLMTILDEDDNSIVKVDLGTVGELSTLSKGGAGAISGTNKGIITNCLNKMKVCATIGAGSMAGINYGTIKNCYNQGAIGTTGNNAVNSTTITDPNFSYSYIGGMAGANFGEIHQCANLNQVFVARLPWLYADNPGGQSDFCGRIRVGGIAGYNYGNYNSETKEYDGGKITECVNYGRIHGDMQVGGIAGYSNGYISDCFFSGLIGGRNSVGGIVGWQPGDREGDFPGEVTNCVSISRVVAGSESVVYDVDGNQYTTVKLTNRSGDTGSNIQDYFKTAKYASNCVYHNNSGNIDPIDYNLLVAEEDNTNSSTSTTAQMAAKVYNTVGFKNAVETGIWYSEDIANANTIVGLASSWQVVLSTRLAWQNKAITFKTSSGDVNVSVVAGIDYINTILVDNAGKFVSDWNANLSGVMGDTKFPTDDVIWVTRQNDATSVWDGLVRDNITLYPMSK